MVVFIQWKLSVLLDVNLNHISLPVWSKGLRKSCCFIVLALLQASIVLFSMCSLSEWLVVHGQKQWVSYCTLIS